MQTRFIWINADTVVNLDSIEYIRFDVKGASILFSSGEKMIVEDKDVRNLKQFMQEKVQTKALPTPHAGGSSNA